MGFIPLLILGLIAGAIAGAILKDRAPGGFLATLVVAGDAGQQMDVFLEVKR